MTPSLIRIARWLYLAHLTKSPSNDALVLTAMDLDGLGKGSLWLLHCHCAIAAAMVEVQR